jgi:hypothetical protein
VPDSGDQSVRVAGVEAGDGVAEVDRYACGEADLESFGFAGPAFAFGFCDAGVEVAADFFQAVALGGVDAEEAVGMGIDEQGALRTVIGTSEEGGYLRPGVMLNDGEDLAAGFGHAERDVLDFMNGNNIDAWVVGATRPICPECAAAIEDSGAEPATPLRGAG